MPSAKNFVNSLTNAGRLDTIDADGLITGADWYILRQNLLTDVSTLSAIEALERGDINQDGMIDRCDFQLFKTSYNDTHGPGAFAAFLAPEPSSLVLLAVAAGGCIARRRG